MAEFRKAERKKAKLRCGISGPSGSGKTFSALLLAFGLGGKIAMIDTENGSGDLYADLGEYDVLPIKSPFTTDKYIEGIKAAEKAGYSTIIIDSLSHAWSGEGGLLDQQGKIADSGRGNSYTAWRTITPKHNALVEAMLQSSCHIVATVRSKTEYVIEKNDKGKDVPRKVGMAPIQREGMEYEFTVFFDLSIEHVASTSKDRTSLFDGQYFKPSRESGEKLLAWLISGADAPPPAGEPPPPEADPDAITPAQIAKIQATFGSLGITDREAKRAWVINALKLEKLESIKDLKKHEASNLISALEDEESKKGAAA
ncbi:MAG: ATP-binding protein [Gallionella sp.]|jgi:hypothetical protein